MPITCHACADPIIGDIHNDHDEECTNRQSDGDYCTCDLPACEECCTVCRPVPTGTVTITLTIDFANLDPEDVWLHATTDRVRGSLSAIAESAFYGADVTYERVDNA